MNHPSDPNTIRALMARPHEEMTASDTQLLKLLVSNAVQAAMEADVLERASAISLTNPALAKASILEETEGRETAFPTATKRLVERDDAMISAEDDVAAMARRLLDACALFRRSPDVFLPGAPPAEGVAFMGRAHDMDGWLLVDGQTVPWVFASNGVSPGTIFEVNRYVANAKGVPYAVVVGASLREGVTLPDTTRFVQLPVDAFALNAGRRA